MRIDEALLEVAGPRHSVRIYRWPTPTISIGANQKISAAILERSERAGIAIVRRPTGGGAVLHDGDLTYSIAGPHHGRGVVSTYVWVAHALIDALRLLGVPARVVAHQPTGRSDAPAEPVGADGFCCFAVPTGADIEVGGRKICGSAQVRRGSRFLQHGTIPIYDPRAKMGQAFSVPSDTSTFLEEVAPGRGWREVADAVEKGFERRFGEPGTLRDLSALERARAMGVHRPDVAIVAQP